MPDTLTPAQRDAIRNRMDIWSDYGPDPTKTIIALLDTADAQAAHIDALTAAVEAVSDAVGNMALAVSKVPTQPQYLTDALDLLKERDDVVLAILGEPNDA